jgi:hypothetical protein
MPAGESNGPLYCLSFHASYRCGHSGACCTAGWPIPVEASRLAGLERASRSGRLTTGHTALLDARDDLPGDVAAVLALDSNGVCVAYDASRTRCRIHGTLGHDALPVSCQHFPRVCLVDRGAAFVTLSGFCPTVARTLVHSSGSWEIVEAPGTLATFALEGLDARQSLPPLLRPGMLMDRESYRRWETLVVRTLSEEATAEQALERCARATEQLRGWKPSLGPLTPLVEAAFSQGAANDKAGGWTCQPGTLASLVRAAVPEGLAVEAPPLPVEQALARWVEPGWPRLAEAVRRYIASRVFANWCAWQGQGLRTVLASLGAALDVLRIEAARQCHAAARVLDEALLVEAIRSADLLILHLADREELARRLGVAEDPGPLG